jgi:avirulence protein
MGTSLDTETSYNGSSGSYDSTESPPPNKPQPTAGTGATGSSKLTRAEVNEQLQAFDGRVAGDKNRYEQTDAAGKNVLQKSADGLRDGVGDLLHNAGLSEAEGYGDDRCRNFGVTSQAVQSLTDRLHNGEDAHVIAAELKTLQGAYETEDGRVAQAQQDNAKYGELGYQIGRGVVMTATGVAVSAVTLNPVAGFAAGAGVGSLMDVGAEVVNNTSGKNTALSVNMDTGNSLGGVAAKALSGEQVSAQQWTQGTVGSAVDGFSALGTGQGIQSAKAAQQALGANAGRRAMGATAALANGAQTFTYGTAGSATKAIGSTVQSMQSGRPDAALQDHLLAGGNTFVQDMKGTAVNTLSSATGSALGVGGSLLGQGGNRSLTTKIADTTVQTAGEGAINIAGESANNLLNGRNPLQLSREQWISSAATTAIGTVGNLSQRAPQAERLPDTYGPRATLDETLQAHGIQRSIRPIDPRAGEIVAMLSEPGSGRTLPDVLPEAQKKQVGQVIDWPGVPAREQPPAATKERYSETFYDSSRQTAQRILDAQQTPGASVPTVLDLWTDARSWRHGVAAETITNQNTVQQMQTARLDRSDRTPLELERYGFMGPRIGALGNGPVRLGDIHPDTPAPWQDINVFDATIVGEGVNGQQIPLSRLTYPAQPLSHTDLVQMARQTQGVQIVHPDLSEQFPAIHARTSRLYQDAIDPAHNTATDQSFVDHAAGMYWWLSQAMPDERGSAAKADHVLHTVFQVQGVQLPPTKPGVVLNLEAIFSNQADFVHRFPEMFERFPSQAAQP